MATSLVHLGDLHAAAGPRNVDRFTALDQIIDEGGTLPRLGAWLWPGDLFDAASTVEDRNAIDARLQRMANVAPVVLCYGNHDRPGDLDSFGRLKATHPVYVVDRPCTLRVLLATAEMAAIFVLPYPYRAGLVGAGVASQDLVGTAADLLEPIFMQAAHDLAAARARGEITLMIGHVNVSGAIVSTGQPNIGREIELSPRHLEQLGPIYVGLNHIHKPQQVAGAWYAGSICRLSYGEVEEKRYLVIEVQRDGDITEFRVGSRPINVAPMFLIDGILDRDGFHFEHDDWMCPNCKGDGDDATAPEGVCQLCGGHGKRRWTGADIRVRYRYKASEKGTLNEAFVHDTFVGALRLKIEPIVVPDRDVRLPAVAEAHTIPEKVAAYRQERQLAPSMAEKVDLLLQRPPDQVLASVAEGIRAIEFQPEEVLA